jgi:predicted deacetylase
MVCTGFALHMKGMDLFEQVKGITDQGMEKNLEKRRKMDNVMTVMRFAKDKLEEAILQVPDSFNTLVYLGKTEHWLALEGYAHLALTRRASQTLAERSQGDMVPNSLTRAHTLRRATNARHRLTAARYALAHTGRRGSDGPGSGRHRCRPAT